jgi:hypothetical protein
MTASADFNTAIVNYSTNAKSLFDAGRTNVPGPSFPAGMSDQDKLARAQGYLGGGFSQLGQAAQMESTQTGREGYAAIVDLMKSTSSCAKAICTRIQNIVAGGAITTADYAVIQALNETLKSLAQISPASVWSTPSSST